MIALYALLCIVALWCLFRGLFPVQPVAGALADMNNRTASWQTAGATIQVGLFTNNFSPTQNNVLADYTEMTIVQFPGYARQPSAPVGTAYIDAIGNASQTFQDPVFQPSANPPAPITVYGYFVVSHPVAGADVLLYGKRFDLPLTVSLATDAVVCDPDITQVPFTAPETE